MHSYPRAAMERMMKIQEVILRAMAKKITWRQAAEIIGMSDRQIWRLHWRYREHGYDGFLDRRIDIRGLFIKLWGDRSSKPPLNYLFSSRYRRKTLFVYAVQDVGIL